jgi:SOS-response transcriptional repressor LexA
MTELRKVRKDGHRYDVLRAVTRDPRASLRELMKETGLRSTSVVAYHLDQLEKEGLIRRDHRKARGIYVNDGQRPPSEHAPKDSPENYAKKVEAGRKSRANSGGAFTGRKAKQKTLAEQARIDAVVKKAQEREALGRGAGGGTDVIRINRSGWTMKGAKLG